MPKTALLYKVLIVFLCLASKSFGQDHWSLGFDYGITYSNVSGKSLSENSNYSLNYVIGSTITYQFDDRVSLRADLLFERKSFKNKIDASEAIDPRIAGRDLKTILSYITIAVMAEYKFGARKNFFIHGGPYAALLLGNKSTIEGFNVLEKNDGSFNSVDYGLTIGVGTIFQFSEYNWMLFEIRHNHGLSDINNNSSLGTGTIKVNAFDVLLTYEFKL